MPKNRTHGVHLRMAGGTVGTRPLHLLQNGSGRAQSQTAAAVFFGNQRRQVAGFGQGPHEFGGVAPLAVGFAPVLHREGGAQSHHAFADFGEVFLVMVVILLMVVGHGGGISGGPGRGSEQSGVSTG